MNFKQLEFFKIVKILYLITVFVSCKNTSNMDEQFQSTLDNNEIVAKPEESEGYSFEILSKKSVGNMVNINVTTTKKLVSKSELSQAASELLELYCQSEQCNVISLWKDAEIYKLYDDSRTENEDPKWMKKNWVKISENLLFDYNVYVGELIFYPLIDEAYRKMGGKMKKPE